MNYWEILEAWGPGIAGSHSNGRLGASYRSG